MGDRANVYIREDETHGVYLYTHWAGSELPEIVRQALTSKSGKARWSDGQYLARIVFCQMLTNGKPVRVSDAADAAEALTGETGFGISARMGDNSYPIIVVDPDKRRIGFAREPYAREPQDDGTQPDPTEWYSFEDYIAPDKGLAKWPAKVHA